MSLNGDTVCGMAHVPQDIGDGIVNIGQAATASGVSAKMIRYYEKAGLIEPTERTASGYRVYEACDVHTLRFIRRARDLGFLVKQIQELLALWRDRGRERTDVGAVASRSEEHTSELQSLMRISYAVFCLKKKIIEHIQQQIQTPLL